MQVNLKIILDFSDFNIHLLILRNEIELLRDSISKLDVSWFDVLLKFLLRRKEFRDVSHHFEVSSGIRTPDLSLSIEPFIRLSLSSPAEAACLVLLLKIFYELDEPVAHLYHGPRVPGHQLLLPCFQ